MKSNSADLEKLYNSDQYKLSNDLSVTLVEKTRYFNTEMNQHISRS